MFKSKYYYCSEPAKGLNNEDQIYLKFTPLDPNYKVNPQKKQGTVSYLHFLLYSS